MSDKTNFRLKVYLAVFTGLLLAGIIGFMAFEGMSLTDAVYFSIVTMATVGYGDLHPVTGIGKLLTLVIIIGGVGTFLGVIASITDVFVNRREEAARQQKIDMVTGLFFSEIGNALLRRFAGYDPGLAALQKELKVSSDWKKEDFVRADGFIRQHHFSIDFAGGDGPALLAFLRENGDFLLRLLENPNIQEHERFTELLRALFHLRDELLNRKDLSDVPETDRRHLEGDMARVYKLLVSEWLRYIRYLQLNYKYLFSLAVRINPFDPDAAAEIKCD